MAKLVVRRSGGGIQLIVLSLTTLPVFVVGFAALGAGLLGLVLWPFAVWAFSKAIQESKEGGVAGRRARDEAAISQLREGESVTTTERGWSKAPIPLPNKLTTKYTLR